MRVNKSHHQFDFLMWSGSWVMRISLHSYFWEQLLASGTSFCRGWARLPPHTRLGLVPIKLEPDLLEWVAKFRCGSQRGGSGSIAPVGRGLSVGCCLRRSHWLAISKFPIYSATVIFLVIPMTYPNIRDHIVYHINYIVSLSTISNY